MSNQKPAEPSWGVTFPEGEQKRVSLYSRDSLTRACQGNERMASVLDYFLFEGSWEIERQKLPKGCKVVAFTRKHEDILKRLTFNLSRKSLIGYLDTFNEWKFVDSEKFRKHYTVHFDTIQTAIDNPPAPKERKPRTQKARKGCNVEELTTEDNASTLAQGCKVEALSMENDASTLLQKVVLLQRKVEELQPYVEEVQRLGCTCSTLQRDFAALLERLEGQSAEDHSLLYYPNLSITNNNSGAFAPADFLPEKEDDFSEEDEPPPTEHRLPAIKLNGHAQQISLPARVAQQPPVAYEDHEQPDGATTEVDSEPRPSPEKPVQQASSTMTEGKETAKQKKARIEKRKSEIIALYCELLGRKKIVLSKDNLDGAKLLAEAESSDAEITTTYKAYKEDKFWGKQLHLKNIAKLLDTTVTSGNNMPAAPAKPKARPTLEEIDVSIFLVDKQFRVYQRKGDDQEWILWEGEFCTPEEADERGYMGGFGLYNVTQYEPLVRGVN